MARSETLQNGILWICFVWNLIVLSLSLSLYLYDNSLKSFKLAQLKQGASLYIWISNQEVPQPRDLFVSAYTLYVWWFIGSVESKLQNVAVCIAQSIIISLRVETKTNPYSQPTNWFPFVPKCWFVTAGITFVGNIGVCICISANSEAILWFWLNSKQRIRDTPCYT